jgi:ABC-type dipeptide/oligopeptide/nickel transport system ATPase subunit
MSLNALRKTQREHGEFLRAHGKVLDEHTKQIHALDSKVGTGFAEMRSKFDQLAGGQQQIVGLLNTVISPQGE